MKDLTVLTPPLLMCVAFLVAVGAFLRHEMSARRRRERDQSGDISGESPIPDSTSSRATTRPDDASASHTD